MSDIVTNARTIHKDQWTYEPADGKWYVVIPFECEENDDVIIDLADSYEYIQEHSSDFDSLENGFTRKNECVITASKKPECDILIEVNKAQLLRGEIIYHKNPETGEFMPEWIPEEMPNIDFGSMIAPQENMPDENNEVVDADVKSIIV